MKIQWDKKAYKDFASWQAQNPKVAKKINMLIDSIQNDGPVNGIGKPESLLNRKQFSRRINDWDRLIYIMKDDVVTIMSCKGHTRRDDQIIHRR